MCVILGSKMSIIVAVFLLQFILKLRFPANTSITLDKSAKSFIKPKLQCHFLKDQPLYVKQRPGLNLNWPNMKLQTVSEPFHFHFHPLLLIDLKKQQMNELERGD